jgi:hypothetical protein
MNIKKINKQLKEAIEKLPIGLCQLSPEMINTESIVKLQQGLKISANLIENTNAAIKLLAEEVQNLRDEIAILKGEQGQPKIRPQSKKPIDNDNSNDNDDNENKPDDQENKNPDISSEDERNPKDKIRKERKTNDDIKITRSQTITFDKSILPNDAIFKGYQSYIVQDIRFELENIEYKREEYYSPSNNRSYVAPLPMDYNGSSYGFNIKSLIITLHHQGKMSQQSIHDFLSNTTGIQIAKSTISNILTNELEIFHEEKDAIVSAGLLATNYVHLDDTGARVKGQNNYVHVLSSPYFTGYFTREHKDRLTILEILNQGIIRHAFTDKTYDLMTEMGISNKVINQFKPFVDQELSTQELEIILQNIFGDDGHVTAKKIITEASAIIAYQQLPEAIQVLVCDDAPQFKQITEILALCWVHAGRHYKKLIPIIPEHKQILNEFITKFWKYYHQLLAFQKNPLSELQLPLSLRFDELFSTVTGYDDLDERIAKTKSQKDNLLVVLEHQEVPLHNNPAELDARVQARRRDISYHTQNSKGTMAKDTLMSIVQTASKLKVNVFAYIKDRISKTMNMTPLADIIRNSSSNITPITPSG